MRTAPKTSGPLWTPSLEFCAESCHVAWGGLIFLVVALHAGPWWASVALIAWATPKEFVIDPLIEHDPIWTNGLIDFAFYVAGGLLGFGLYLL